MKMDVFIKDLKNYASNQIIDIRNREDYLKYHIDGSKNVLYSDLIIHPEKYLDRKKAYVIICEQGILSKKIS